LSTHGTQQAELGLGTIKADIKLGREVGEAHGIDQVHEPSPCRKNDAEWPSKRKKEKIRERQARSLFLTQSLRAANCKPQPLQQQEGGVGAALEIAGISALSYEREGETQ
jgi:hypothetical protein